MNIQFLRISTAHIVWSVTLCWHFIYLSLPFPLSILFRKLICKAGEYLENYKVYLSPWFYKCKCKSQMYIQCQEWIRCYCCCCFWLTFLLIGWFNDFLINRLTDWLSDWVGDSVRDWQIDRLIDRSIDWLLYWFIYWLF